MKKVAVALTSAALLMGCGNSTSASSVTKESAKPDIEQVASVTAPANTLKIANVTAQSKLTSFIDVTPSHWAYKEISFLLKNGIVDALSGSKYAPNDPITRGHAARMLAKSLKLDVNNSSYQDVTFPDVPKSHPDYPYIKAVVNEQIFKGQTDGKFGVNNPLTRAQMAKVLVETFDLRGDYPMNFKDVQAGNWAFQYIDTLAAAEVTNGYHDLTYKPNMNVTRAQMAAFVYRAMEGSPFDDSKIMNYFGGFGPYTQGQKVIKNGVILFGEYGKYENYLPSNKLNPYINRQVYQVTKSLLDPNYYVTTQYEEVADFGKRVRIAFGHTAAGNSMGNYRFAYYLNEDRYMNYGNKPLKSFSDKPVIMLDIRGLWFDYNKMDKKTFTEPIYSQKLKDSLVALFPNGNDLYNVVLAKYVESQSKKEILETKKVGNIQLDFQTSGRSLVVKFSYL
jgi:hypothetical protein